MNPPKYVLYDAIYLAYQQVITFYIIHVHLSQYTLFHTEHVSMV